ncbi:MAG: hypothetical protein IPH07_10795 [Deltaproteobacteria bacterium]|nr:hypothetical protein [Deltaproteobacteria bacterium]MBK8718920.1 hypothetical protein [Deltaproteobacteria bacterium]MBP7289201.1 hypothetical protein [Nannocystaceae bacterium]
MTGTALALVLAGELPAGPRHRLDVPLPEPPAAAFGPDGIAGDATFREARVLGTPTVLFVNFDGVHLRSCNPSDARHDCHWYNNDPIPAFSGSLQTRVAILQAMRAHAAPFGVRVTGTRPSFGNYTMVVYGGTEAEFGALGSAPSGDCGDANPNEIAFAHLDGELVDWVVAGATTSLHEAAHTWGLDHVDLASEIMYPEGDDSETWFDDACHGVVQDTDLTPGPAACPALALELCDDAGRQNSVATLHQLFGPAFVDDLAPRLSLLSPEDGTYLQAPASFEVRLAIDDAQDPQEYAMWTWLDGEPRPAQPTRVLAPGFRVEALPPGSWRLHVVVADEAGNEAALAFEVEVGVDPPPAPDDGDRGCRVGSGTRDGWAIVPLLLAAWRRRR